MPRPETVPDECPILLVHTRPVADADALTERLRSAVEYPGEVDRRIPQTRVGPVDDARDDTCFDQKVGRPEIAVRKRERRRTTGLRNQSSTLLAQGRRQQRNDVRLHPRDGCAKAVVGPCLEAQRSEVQIMERPQEPADDQSVASGQGRGCRGGTRNDLMPNSPRAISVRGDLVRNRHDEWQKRCDHGQEPTLPLEAVTHVRASRYPLDEGHPMSIVDDRRLAVPAGDSHRPPGAHATGSPRQGRRLQPPRDWDLRPCSLKR